MARVSDAQVRMVLVILFRLDHSATLIMRDVNAEIMEREIEL